jgi:hypothetical protein
MALTIVLFLCVPWFASHDTMQPLSNTKSIFVLVVLFTISVILPVGHSTETRRMYMKSFGSSGHSDLEVNELGFSSLSSDGGSSFTPWSRFSSFQEYPTIFMLNEGPPCYLVVSKSSLTPDQQAELRTSSALTFLPNQPDSVTGVLHAHRIE